MTEPFQPLSVRNGTRDPLPYHDGIPEHLESQLLAWVGAEIGPQDSVIVSAIMLAELQIPPSQTARTDQQRILHYCGRGNTETLDVIDYLLASHPVFSAEIDDAPTAVLAMSYLLGGGRSLWTVVLVAAETVGQLPGFTEQSPYRAVLQRRVPKAVEEQYLAARGIGGTAGDQLTKAWHAAYGLDADAEVAWKAAIKAVEAALTPVVEPDTDRSSLGKLRKLIAAAPHKWVCDLPVWDDEKMTEVDAFLQCLSRVTYDYDRHPSTGGAPVLTLEAARAVLMQAVTICEWIRTGIFRRADTA